MRVVRWLGWLVALSVLVTLVVGRDAFAEPWPLLWDIGRLVFRIEIVLAGAFIGAMLLLGEVGERLSNLSRQVLGRDVLEHAETPVLAIGALLGMGAMAWLWWTGQLL